MPDDQVQFRSPTTGKVQAVLAENWEEALSRGYTPTTHKVMYSPEGQRGMVPNGELRDYVKQGYQTTPKTEAEKKITGEGISLKGSGQALWDKLKSVVPEPPKGRPLGPTAKEFWLGSGPSFDPANSGLAQAGRETASEYQRSRKAGSNPIAAAGSAAVVGAGSMLGASEQEQRGMAERGEGGQIIGSSAAPVVMSAVLPELSKLVAGKVASGPAPKTGGGGVSAAEVLHAIRHPGSALATYVVKQVLRGMSDEATPETKGAGAFDRKPTAPPPTPKSSIIDPNNPPPVDYKVTFQSLSAEDLMREAMKGNVEAAREMVRRHGTKNLPPNLRYLLDPSAGTKSWRDLPQ